MKRYWAHLVLLLTVFADSGAKLAAKEYLTEKEIDQLREHQEISKRTELYIKFASLRLATFKERVKGIESKEGDPLEFHSLEDLISGYSHALKSLEANLDDAVVYKKDPEKKIIGALEKLKASAEKFRPSLNEILNYAINKKDEPLYNLIKEALAITEAAIEGANTGVENYNKSKAQKPNRRGSK